jgi:hypothetical protein
MGMDKKKKDIHTMIHENRRNQGIGNQVSQLPFKKMGRRWDRGRAREGQEWRWEKSASENQSKGQHCAKLENP